MKIDSWLFWISLFMITPWFASAYGQGANMPHLITLHNEVNPITIVIRVGDTVTWIAPYESHRVDSFNSDWSSPLLTNSGATFSYTFDREGDFAYRSRKFIGDLLVLTTYGMVRVLPRLDPPPAVEITSPIEGFVFTNPGAFTIQAAVTNRLEDIISVEFFVGTNLVGTATNYPYRVNSGGVISGEHPVSAKITDRQDGVTFSKPVTIMVLPPLQGLLSGLKRLPTGQYMLYYTTPMFHTWTLESSEDLRIWSTRFIILFGSGLWVDETAPCVRQRFYRFYYEAG